MSFKDKINIFANDLETKINKTVSDTVLSIKTAVSKDKNRFTDGTFNLDLTYITNRIIAMGYIASEEEESSIWRNSRKEVKGFLDLYHPDRYLILNLTEKPYDSTYFNGRVTHLGWPDHSTPSMGLLLHLTQIMHQWLTQDEQNVVAIHCLAGRGRTGTLICSYLLSTELYVNQVDKVLQLFANLRSSTGEGVRVQSQLRYISYVNQLANRSKNIDSIQNPVKLYLTSMIVNPIPKVSKGSDKPWNPIIKIFNSTKPLQPQLLYCNKNILSNCNGAMYTFNNLLICGDIIVKIYANKHEILIQEYLENFFDKSTLKFSFHSSFIENNYLDLSLHQLDGNGTKNLSSKKFPEDFKIRLLFQPVIETTNSDVQHVIETNNIQHEPVINNIDN